MKLMSILIITLALFTSCAKEVHTEAVVIAKDGLNGTNGLNGEDGQNGMNGTNGLNGENGVNASPLLKLKNGLICNVYDSYSIDRNNGLIKILNNAKSKFTKVIELFDVGDSRAVNGFPKFTSAEQALIGTEDYALDCFGYLDVPVSGNYTFKMLSDDNSRLAINDVTILNMDAIQAPTSSISAAKLFYAGLNRINILYFQGPHTQIALSLDWSTPTSASMSTMQLVPSSALKHMVME